MDRHSPVRSTDTPSRRRTPCRRSSRSALLLLLPLLLTLAGPFATGSAAVPVTSEAGVTPEVWSGHGGGGNVTCADIAPPSDLLSSPRMNWNGRGFSPSAPTGIEVIVVDSTTVSWSAEWPITAVIVKGSSAAHVYRYAPARGADAGLVPPVNPSGKPAELSNLTFCWLDDDDDDDEVDLTALCESAATSADVGPIVSSSGVMRIRDGAVDASSVPAGHTLTLDPITERIDFTAPYPVVVVVTKNSDPVVHPIAPPSTSGSVAFSTNPGNGDVVLCGLESTIVVQASCDLMPGTTLFGPVPIRGWTIDETHITSPMIMLSNGDDELDFLSSEPVAGVIIVASDPVVHAFEPAVTDGTVPLVIDNDTGDADLMFCLLRTATNGGGGGGGGGGDDGAVTPLAVDAEQEEAQAPVPTEIASGEGPSPRSSLGLVALTMLALAATRWRSASHH